MLAHDALDGLDAFHLRHGNVHEHDVRLDAVVLRDGGQAVAGFSGQLAAEHLDHFDEVLSREDRIVHHEVADRLTVFSQQSAELFHDLLLVPAGVVTSDGTMRVSFRVSRLFQLFPQDLFPHSSPRRNDLRGKLPGPQAESLCRRNL